MLIPILIFLPPVIAAVAPFYKVFNKFWRSRKNSKGCVVYIAVPDDGRCSTLEIIINNLYYAITEFYGSFRGCYINISLIRSHNLIMAYLPIKPEHVDGLLAITEEIDKTNYYSEANCKNATKVYLSKFYPKQFATYISKANSVRMTLIPKKSVCNMKFSSFSGINLSNAHRYHYDPRFLPNIYSIPEKRLYDDKKIATEIAKEEKEEKEEKFAIS